MAVLFEALDETVTGPARQALHRAQTVMSACRDLVTAAQNANLHDLSRRAAQASAEAGELAALAGELQRAAAAPGLGISEPDGHAAYAQALEQAASALRLPLAGTYPDYRVFPFALAIRLAEGRAIVNGRACHCLRPAAVAAMAKTELARFSARRLAAERFAAVLVRAFDLLLPETRERLGPAAGQVPLREVHQLLRTFGYGGRAYAAEDFAFDLYRFRQTPMRWRGRRVLLGDMRNGGTGFEVPNSRGGFDRLNALATSETADGTGGSEG